MPRAVDSARAATSRGGPLLAGEVTLHRRGDRLKQLRPPIHGSPQIARSYTSVEFPHGSLRELVRAPTRRRLFWLARRASSSRSQVVVATIENQPRLGARKNGWGTSPRDNSRTSTAKTGSTSESPVLPRDGAALAISASTLAGSPDMNGSAKSSITTIVRWHDRPIEYWNSTRIRERHPCPRSTKPANS